LGDYTIYGGFIAYTHTHTHTYTHTLGLNNAPRNVEFARGIERIACHKKKCSHTLGRILNNAPRNVEFARSTNAVFKRVGVSRYYS
jgi:23S rRNA A2030 N6-methylase RlmJ